MTKFDFFKLASKVFFTFEKADGKIYNVVPTKGKKIKFVIESIPSKLYTLDKTTATLACFYVNFRYNPSSIFRMMEKLKEIELKEISEFKEYLLISLRTYKSEFKELNKGFFKISLSEAISFYNQKKINFISLYYFIIKNNLKKEVEKSLIYKIIFSKIETLILFLKTSKTIDIEEP